MSSQLRLRTVKCEKCGGSVQLRAGAVSTQCSQCGAPVTLAAALKAESDLERWHPNPTALRPGMKATFREQEYELTGRLVQEMYEEGVPYRWEEYELVAANGDCLFLEFDEGRWKLMETFTPTNPIAPMEAVVMRPGSRVTLDGSTANVVQVSRATTVFVQGELTFAAQVGDSADYLDAQSWKQLFTVEWTADEIEFYRGSFLSEREVLVAFSLQEQLASLDAQENKRKAQRFFASACLLFAVMAFLIGAGGSSGGVVVAQNTTAIASVPPEGIRFGPITLDPNKRVHRLEINGSMTQASAWVAGVLESSQDGAELIGAQGDFWDESGYDEGPWHEWSLSSHTDFVATNPGPYFVRLYTERDTPYGNYGSAGFVLRGRVMHSDYLFWFGTLAVILAIIFFCVGYKEQLAAAAAKAAESDDDDD